MVIDTTRPKGYKKGTKVPVDISPRVRRANPSPTGRKPFFDDEEVTIGHLAGAHALKRMILDAHNECLAIKEEMMGIVERYIPKDQHRSFDYIHIMTGLECAPSPIGLCVVDFILTPDICMFCGQQHNK